MCYSKKKFSIIQNIEVVKEFKSKDPIYYGSIIIRDINSDCKSELISMGTEEYHTTYNASNKILIINAETGDIDFKLKTFYYNVKFNILILDIDKDGVSEFIIAADDTPLNPNHIRSRLVCYKLDGTIVWISDQKFAMGVSYAGGGSLNSADFNSDGIPEIYLLNEIFNFN